MHPGQPQINELNTKLARAQEAGAESEAHKNAQIAESTAQVRVN